jgi:hypothetical protein
LKTVSFPESKDKIRPKLESTSASLPVSPLCRSRLSIIKPTDRRSGFCARPLWFGARLRSFRKY